MTTRTVAAVDIGASSGRVMLATVSETSLSLREVHRFPNRPVRVGGTLHWDVLALYAGVLDGLRAAARHTDRLDGVGVDTWAVDYGLLDADGALLANPVHYRDGRTAGAAERVRQVVGAPTSSTPAPASRTCPSTPSTSSSSRPRAPGPAPRAPPCSCRTCSRTG